MTDWLLAHALDVQSYALLAALGVVAVWETFLPRRTLAAPAGARWLQHTALVALGALAIRLCMPVTALAVASAAQARGFGLLNAVELPAAASLLLGVAALDFANYVTHRLSHGVPLLWRFHQVHHCDLDVDCGTSVRHHPGEALVAQAAMLAAIVVFGVSPVAALLGLALGSVAAVFSHGNIALHRRLDNALRAVVVTPDMHRIHHSARVDESNRNFANLLSVWDRLFATYQQDSRGDQRQFALGLPALRSPRDVSLRRLLALPFRRVPDATTYTTGPDDAGAIARL